jgi:hypothetical protein
VSRGKEKDLEHVLLKFCVVIKKNAEEHAEIGIALPVGHVQRRRAMKAA